MRTVDEPVLSSHDFNLDLSRYSLLMELLKRVGFENIIDFQASQSINKDGKFGLLSYKKLYNLLLNPIEIPFKDYPIGQVFPKRQIVIHHSAGWDNARGMFQDWDTDARKGVCTSCAINDNGELYRGFDESFWGHALGVEESEFKRRGIKNSNNLTLNRQSVQIEICSFGALTALDSGGYQTWSGNRMPQDKIDEVSFRGVKAFERYTEKEINTLETWILLNALRFEIPLTYREVDFWNVSGKALSGEPGIWGHCSFRTDKTDPYPQPQLLEMLSNLPKYGQVD